jgi:hypothetical protein
MRIQREMVQKIIAKDQIGNPKETFPTIGFFFSGPILPYGEKLAQSEYGYNGTTTHQTVTYSNLVANQYIKANDSIYYVKYVAKYPRHSVLLLEVV